jgi:carboxypeptidase C (cathepsin A)
VLYVEQPLRTGYSRAAYGAERVTVEAQVARDFYGFLESFFSVFVSLRGIPMFISGESYAGAYIPWIADYIIQSRLQVNQSDSSAVAAVNMINLQGVAIGNGVIDDLIQV